MNSLALLTVWLAFGATDPPKTPDQVPHRDSRMLSIKIEPGGIQLLQTLEKKGLQTRLPQDWPTHPYRWRLLDAQGDVLVEGAFDPGPLCLDPKHAGWQPHVHGDQVTPHVAFANVKVPDLGAQARRVQFLRRAQPRGAWQTVATHELPAVPEKR